jgi:hypothetical protein
LGTIDRRLVVSERRPGRPALGADLVGSIEDASPVARSRLEAILRNLSGEWTIEEAAASVGMKRSWFCDLRKRYLRESAELLEPRRPGPTPREATDAERVVAALKERIVDLELDVEAAEIREELALAGIRPLSDEELDRADRYYSARKKGARRKRRSRSRSR